MNQSAQKFVKIREALLARIKDGYWGRGVALPSERLLALEFGVSYMTARKAVSELVEEQYLERRGRSGTFVRADLEPEKADRILGIIVSPWSELEQVDYTAHASELALRSSWLPKVIYALDYADRTVFDAVATCDAVICLSLGFLQHFPEKVRELIRARDIPFVLMGALGIAIGVDSVCCADPKPVGMAVDHLLQNGHTEIAYATQLTGDLHSPSIVDKSYWMQKLQLSPGQQRLRDLLLEFELPSFGEPQRLLYELLLRRYDEHGGSLPFTALVVPLVFAWGALAALRDLQIKVPEQMSVIVIGDRREAQFYRPHLTMIRSSMARHVEEAWHLIEQRLAPAADGLPTTSLCRFIEPELVLGETVRPYRPIDRHPV